VGNFEEIEPENLFQHKAASIASITTNIKAEARLGA
jgi:hypothetical protein